MLEYMRGEKMGENAYKTSANTQWICSYRRIIFQELFESGKGEDNAVLLRDSKEQEINFFLKIYIFYMGERERDPSSLGKGQREREESSKQTPC